MCLCVCASIMIMMMMIMMRGLKFRYAFAKLTSKNMSASEKETKTSIFIYYSRSSSSFIKNNYLNETRFLIVFNRKELRDPFRIRSLSFMCAYWNFRCNWVSGEEGNSGLGSRVSARDVCIIIIILLYIYTHITMASVPCLNWVYWLTLKW